MTFQARSMGKMTLMAGMLVASVAFFVAGLLNARQSPLVAQTQGSSGSPVTAISLKSTITPNPVTAGQTMTISGSLSVVGGPTPAKITVTVPTGGGSVSGSFSTMLDENGLWGFDAPPFKMPSKPGTYQVTIKAEAGTVSDTKDIAVTVNPAP